MAAQVLIGKRSATGSTAASSARTVKKAMAATSPMWSPEMASRWARPAPRIAASVSTVTALRRDGQQGDGDRALRLLHEQGREDALASLQPNVGEARLVLLPGGGGGYTEPGAAARPKMTALAGRPSRPIPPSRR